MSQAAVRPPVPGTGRDPVLVSRRLSKWFGKGDGLVRAVDGIDFHVIVGHGLNVRFSFHGEHSFVRSHHWLARGGV